MTVFSPNDNEFRPILERFELDDDIEILPDLGKLCRGSEVFDECSPGGCFENCESLYNQE